MKKGIGLVLVLIALAPAIRLGQLGLARHEIDRSSPAWRARDDALSRARVLAPSRPAAREVPTACVYVSNATHGTTPKFDCRLPDGTTVKVKYGDSPEIPAEVAATGLLSMLGFPADRMAIIPRLRCFGCPPAPFRLRHVAEWFLASPLVDLMVDPSHAREFDWSAMEWKFEAPAIEPDGYQGWQWSDLLHVEVSRGGATGAELDALRLVGVFLADWDNKSENQRLVCLDELPPRGAAGAGRLTCQQPLLMLQDLGATFGPVKLNLEKWRAAPIWADAAACRTDMASLPYRGATFLPVQISEAGRVLLAQRLRQITEAQLRELLTSARFPDPVTGRPDGDVTPWVRVFEEKVRQIADRPVCPPFR